MAIPLLQEIVIIFALSIAVILACHRLKVPPIVGFLLTGVLAGPHGLALISAVDDVDMLATIGIVLLLFTVGMEFSLKKIFEYKRYFFIGGSLQVLLTLLAGTLAGFLLHRPWGECLFLGCLLSLSSTAIVLRVLDEKSESNTPHGKISVGIMIFQDIIAIPMMLVTPYLAGIDTTFNFDFFSNAAIGIVILTASLFAAYKLVPQLLYHIAKTRNRELFLLSVITICFAVAWLTSSVGLSLSLGAFLAGLIISDSEYRHEAIGDILPFQDLFTSFFFISVGMLLNIAFFLDHPFTIILIASAVLLLKTGTAATASLVAGLPLRAALLSGISLSQIGEFSFVLAKTGFAHGLVDDYRYQLFLAISIITMSLTPSLINWSPRLVELFLTLPIPHRLKYGMKIPEEKQVREYRDHLIIIGFGINGRNLAYSAKEANIPYAILEMNPETVKIERARGEEIFYGDASHPAVLHHLNIKEAQAIAVLINDFNVTRRVVKYAHQINPHAYIIVRTHYLQQAAIMYELGATEVVPDEFGSSIEIFTRVMNLFDTPPPQIEKIVDEVRSAFYDKFKAIQQGPSTFYDLTHGLSHLSIKSFKIKENSPLAGKTLAQLDLRNKYNVTIISITREKATLGKVDAQTIILANDILTLVGEHRDLKNAITQLD